ncbi:MAG: hypothetical protein WCC06_06740 [Candidatus Aminicenantales bacterium]
MKTDACREFQDWLDRLPLSDLTDKMKQHLDVCGECRRQYALIAPVVKALSGVPLPEKLSEDSLKKFTIAAEQEALRRKSRKAALRMARSLLMGLPFVVAINWLWVRLGSTALTEFVSSDIAFVYSVVLLVGASLAAALIFGAIPLLWGHLQGHSPKEFQR